MKLLSVFLILIVTSIYFFSRFGLGFLGKQDELAKYDVAGEIVDYNTIVDQVTDEVEGSLSNHYKMEALAGNDKIATWENRPTLEFQIVGPLTKEALRGILIEGVEIFLSQINSNEKLRPFLKTYPYTVDEIDIGIRITDKNDGLIFDPDIYAAFVRDGKLYFHTIDKYNVYKFKTTESEDYQTALEKVRKAKQQ